MLRKLLKHEFRATARVMIPLYLITVLLAVLTRATALWAEMVTFDGMLGRNFLALLSGIIIFGFVLALIATFVVAVILAILRFRSNLMADEGYVMFTLPVSTHTLVWSKLIVSAVWFLGAVVVDVLSLLALVANVEMFWELGRVFQEIADQWNAPTMWATAWPSWWSACSSFWCSVWSPAWSFTRLWPSAIALPNIKCCCLWPSFSPSRW